MRFARSNGEWIMDGREACEKRTNSFKNEMESKQVKLTKIGIRENLCFTTRNDVKFLVLISNVIIINLGLVILIGGCYLLIDGIQ